MYCDALTLACVAAELRQKLLGGRIQQVVQVDRLALGLEVYAHPQRHYVLLSAEPEEGGHIHLVPHKLRRGPSMPSPLLLRLRKTVRTGHLTEIQQPPQERILRFTVDGPEGLVVLVVEVMGRRSNILLLDEDGTVLECIRHVPASQNRYRVSLPGHLYVPPPAQPKADAMTLTAGRLAQVLGDQDPTSPLWQKLVASLRGVSPLLAREVVYRVSGDVGSSDADAQSVLAQLVELLSLAETGQWQPSIALERGRVVAYAPYILTHYSNCQAAESISMAMAAYDVQREQVDPYAVAKSRWQEIIAEQRGRLGRKRAALLDAQPDPEVLDELRSSGEWLLAYASQIPPGQVEWIVRTEESQPALRIPLDPTKSAVENAREYFRRYEKAKSAAAEVPGLLAQVDAELAYLEQLATDLALAEDQPGIVAVESLLAEAGHLPKAKQMKRPAAGPLRVLSEDGFVIWVGRNSWQNEEVTFRRATGADVWLHAQGVPGAHVLIRAQGQTVPEATLQRAAELAAHYSAARCERRVAVDYTLRKNVRRIAGGRLGQVTYKGQKTIVASPKAWQETAQGQQ